MVEKDGKVVFCHGLSDDERIKIVLNGDILTPVIMHPDSAHRVPLKAYVGLFYFNPTFEKLYTTMYELRTDVKAFSNHQNFFDLYLKDSLWKGVPYGEDLYTKYPRGYVGYDRHTKIYKICGGNWMNEEIGKRVSQEFMYTKYFGNAHYKFVIIGDLKCFYWRADPS